MYIALLASCISLTLSQQTLPYTQSEPSSFQSEPSSSQVEPTKSQSEPSSFQSEPSSLQSEPTKLQLDVRSSLLYSPWVFHPYEAQEIRWSQTAPPPQSGFRPRYNTALKQTTIDVNIALYHVNHTVNDIISEPSTALVFDGLQSQARDTCILIPMHEVQPIKAIVLTGDEEDEELVLEESGICHHAFANIDPFEDILVCGGTLRFPRAESWDYWRLLDSQDKYTGSKGWQTLNDENLKLDLLDISQSDFRRIQKGQKAAHPPKTIFERTAYFPDGSRKSYLEFDLTRHLRKMFKWAALESPPIRPICYAYRATSTLTGNSLYEKIVKVGDLIRARAPETGRMAPLTETSMRVFFDPGWRLDATVIGNHLSFQNRLSIKLNSCAGKLDDLSIRSAAPVKWYTKGSETLSPMSGSNWIKSLFSNSRLYPQALQFILKVDALQEEDSTVDWRRAAFLLRRKERKAALVKIMSNTSTTTTQRRNKALRAPNDEHIKMYLCLYGDQTEQFGIPVGSTQFALASTDAAEFVAISIMVLLGLPVSCMWTLGCLGYKHKKLRQELRRMRLMQQRDQIETRLAGYLGFDYKTNEESSDEETDTFETQPPVAEQVVEYSQLAWHSSASPVPPASSPETMQEPPTEDIDAPLLNSEARL